MSYLVLARRWRPKIFADVVGQSHVVKTVQNGLRQGRLAHAFLFSGPRGIGKTTTARLLARAINCLGVGNIAGAAPASGEPCNECRLCEAALNGRAIDVVEIDAASNTGVDDIRILRDNVNYTPIEGRAKVYIVDEVHMLSTNAFNALLKTLEEPPAHAYFCLATTAPQKVPPTILSRCQRFDFRRVSAAEIRSHLEHILKAENIEYDLEALDIIARKADGSVRDSLSLLDQVIAFAGGRALRPDVVEALGEIRLDLYFKALELAKSHSIAEAFRLDAELANFGVDVQDYLSGLQSQIIQILQVKSTGIEKADVLPEYREDYLQAARKFTEADLIRILNLTAQAEVDVRRNFSPRLRQQLLLLKFTALEHSLDIAELIENLKSGKSSAGGAVRTAPSKPAASVPSSSKPSAATAPSGIRRPGTDLAAVSALPDSGDKLKIPVEEVVATAQSAWDDVCEQIAQTHNSSGRIIQSGGYPVSFDNGVLKLHFIDAMHLDRGQACRQALQKALAERVGAVRLEFAVGEVPRRALNHNEELDPAIATLIERFDAKPVN
ncbi:MAG: DNA polymerase III subunit gamma/tau [Calditrichaeota bacterium]|nr:DNA polymerase III subunit gamma/tau [Calditrichota bacterium]